MIDTIPPEASNLLKPDNGSILIDATPTFSWSSAQGADRYLLIVDSDQTFSSPEIENFLNETTFTPTASLSAGTYYWVVYSVDNAFNGTTSATRVFTIQGG